MRGARCVTVSYHDTVRFSTHESIDIRSTSSFWSSSLSLSIVMRLRDLGFKSNHNLNDWKKFQGFVTFWRGGGLSRNGDVTLSSYVINNSRSCWWESTQQQLKSVGTWKRSCYHHKSSEFGKEKLLIFKMVIFPSRRSSKAAVHSKLRIIWNLQIVRDRSCWICQNY